MARSASKLSLKETVQSLVDDAATLCPDGSNLPPIVLENRQRRAFDRVVAALESRGTEQIPAELSAEVEQLLARWAREWFDDGFRPMEAFEVRCANERELVLARQSGDQQQILAALQRDLRRRIVERFGRIEIRGIQTSQRVLLELERIFIPLHVEAPFPSDGPKRGLIAIPWLRTAVTDVLRQRPRLLIVGAPGSGKSTLVAWLATRLADGNLATQLGWEPKRRAVGSDGSRIH
jgi:predicted NACHT family NTPase